MPKDTALEAILEKLQATRNFDFRNYKRATLTRRIEHRMAERHLGSQYAYLELLDREPAEIDALVSALLIKLTGFFRDPEIWKELGERIIPEVISRRREVDEIRVWSAGCATGEEAYSIAMLLAEAL